MLQAVVSPSRISDIAETVARSPSPLVMGGGTTVMPMINSGDHDIETLVSLRQLALNEVTVSKNGIVTIGACTPISALAKQEKLSFLKGAIDSFGSPAIRNMATVGGNLFVQRPAGDLAVCLVALDATATIAMGASKRVEAVNLLVQRGLKPGEVVTEVSFALPEPGSFKYRKAGRRALNTPSIVTVAAVVPIVNGRVKDCRIALGAVVARPSRAPHVEQLLEGRELNAQSVMAAAEAAASDIEPVDDAVASAWYRARVTPVHIRRAILGE